MSSILSGLEGLATRSAGEAVAFGLGIALGAALTPEGTALAQDVWAATPTKAVDVNAAAAIVAENVEQREWGAGEAAKHGIDGDRFDALLGEVLAAPAFAQLVTMLRRGTISGDDFLHGLRKAKLETRWDNPLTELRQERLEPATLADGIQRSVLPDPGYLLGGIDVGGSNVPILSESGIDVGAEAAASGYNDARLGVLVKNAGNPPSPGELLQLVNRGAINEAAFGLGVRQGRTRNEWAPFLLTLRRRLLTPREYAELRLRGWIDDAAMHAGAGLSGMETADTDLLFKVSGRPIPVHQVTTGLARGGEFAGPTGDIPEAYIRSLEEGNQRPEWYSLSYANRYTYPSAFVLRTLATTGELSATDVHQTLLELGWRPDFAEKVTRAWTGGTVAKADPHVTKAENQLWTTLHRSYVNDESDEAVAGEALTALGVAPAGQPQVLALWDREREIVRRTLTPSQIKKAFTETKFTRDDAIARLERLGYSAADAGTLLDE